MFSPDINWSAPADDVICGKSDRLLEVIWFILPDDAIFRDPVDASVDTTFILPDDAMLIFIDGGMLKLPVEGRTLACTGGARLRNPGRLLWRRKGPCVAVATGDICKYCAWGCTFCCDVFVGGLCCIFAVSIGETEESLTEPIMCGVAGVMTNVFCWLLFDTIVGAVANCWKRIIMRNYINLFIKINTCFF